MTVTPPPIDFVLPSGIARLVKNAVSSDSDGVLSTIAALVGNTRDVMQRPDGTWPAVTRRAWLSYRWVARYDVTKPPPPESGALPGDQYVGGADGFLQDAGTTTVETARTAYMVEDFTGIPSGAGWPTARWVNGQVGPGGGAVVENGAGRITSGNTGGYIGSDMTGVRSTMTDVRDIEVEFDFTLGTATESEVRLNLRTLEPSMMMATGIVVSINASRINIAVANQWTYTTLTTATKKLTASTTYRARVVCVTQTSGSALLRVRVWPTSGSEPSTWDVDALSNLPGSGGSGYWGLCAPGIGDPIRNTVLLDNIKAYKTPPTDHPEWWGTRA